MNRTVAQSANLSARKKVEAEITLGMLSAVEQGSSVTQRSLARELGVALGLVNGYLRRCVAKGWIKVSTAPANRYAYYLTPRGFAEKSRLTAQYLTISFDFFRTARNQCLELIRLCEQQGWRRVALCGKGELAEIMVLCAEIEAIDIVALVDPEGGSSIKRLPVITDASALPQIDAAIVTDQRDPQGTYDRLATLISAERILAPPLLKISRPRSARRG
jgi:DNA-binding MarR family transcriptional regulator